MPRQLFRLRLERAGKRYLSAGHRKEGALYPSVPEVSMILHGGQRGRDARSTSEKQSVGRR